MLYLKIIWWENLDEIDKSYKHIKVFYVLKSPKKAFRQLGELGVPHPTPTATLPSFS